MELSSHLLVDSSFGSVAENEMALAANLINNTPDNNIVISQPYTLQSLTFNKFLRQRCAIEQFMPLLDNLSI
ncbi:hypothetical protein [Shewanella piezotolerans]|nr:hypothetical protein [Shewanella piezotolerans]